MRLRSLLLGLAVPILSGVLASACGVGDFDPSTKLNSVRILASRADKPYAKPGDTVNLDLLAVDARTDQTRPMKVYWLPYSCINPANDTYYACFAAAAGADGGAARDASAGSGQGGQGAGLGNLLRPGVDLTPFLVAGTSYQVTVPPDIIDKHPPVQGAPEPYGLIVLFNIACAGHVEAVDTSQVSGPQVIPVGCFDDNHVQLGPSEYVIGFTRIYAYATRTNANPVIDDVILNGSVVKLGPASDRSTGIVLAPCNGKCSDAKIDVHVPASSQEDNPGDVDPDGTPHKEQIWVDYFATQGTFSGDARLLYDTKTGPVSESEIPFTPSDTPEEGLVFAVVHDNRDGVAWVQIPLHIR